MDKTDFTVLFAAALVIIILKRVLGYFRELRVAAIPTRTEQFSLVLGVLVLLAVGYFFAPKFWHNILTLLAAITFVLAVLKDGVSDSAVFIYARGKNRYSFSELRSAEITRGEIISVKYVLPSGAPLVVQRYRPERFSELIAIFDSAAFPYSLSEE